MIDISYYTVNIHYTQIKSQSCIIRSLQQSGPWYDRINTLTPHGHAQLPINIYSLNIKDTDVRRSCRLQSMVKNNKLLVPIDIANKKYRA